MIILTDAPKSAIENWCHRYNWEMENDKNSYFDSLKATYYVKVLADSEFDMEDVKEAIGFDEVYDLEDYLNPDHATKIKKALEENVSSLIGSCLQKDVPSDIPPELALALEQKVWQVAYQVETIVNFLNITHNSEEPEFPENIIASLEEQGCCYSGESKVGPAIMRLCSAMLIGIRFIKKQGGFYCVY